MRRNLPTGTVTFVFSDIDGSTKLLNDLGPEAYGEALLEHRRVLRKAFTRRGGVEVDTQGDALFVAFPTARGALEAAHEAQEALAAGPISVRIGIHSGAPHVTSEGYVGHDVHTGARIAAAGHGGQVLLSRATRDLVDGDVTDLGEHRLKDLAEPVWIYQLGSERFPPLKTISNTNLPRPASSFVGREKEVDEVAALLRGGARLLTLTGPGGTGKTRLGIEAAAELVPEFKAGVFWVGLAPVRESAVVIETIAQTLGAKHGLAKHIGERDLLLLVDNLEHLIDAAPELASLVETCPNLRLLVTSRELLRVRGELEYPVSALSEPEAVALFCARSRLEADVDISELCGRLDNLPLAVELAAARASVLSPRQILERLAQRLDLLKGGRDSEARQQTLRATIEWSHDLLGEEEQRLFVRLAVFHGGCTIEAAEGVADADLDVLQSLVGKNLIRRVGERFSMLETIREYALERLEPREAVWLRRRHAAHFLALAEKAEPHLVERGVGVVRDGNDAWLDRLEREHDNIRAALDWLHESGQTELGLRMAGAISEFWCGNDHVAEGRRRLERAIRVDDRPTAARAKALVGAAHMARDSGDAQTARLRAEEALALSRELADLRSGAVAAFYLALADADEGDFAQARRFFELSGRGFRQLGADHHALLAARMVAWMHHELGERQYARELDEDNLRRARALGNRQLEATTLGTLASHAVKEGRLDAALVLAAKSLRISLELGRPRGVVRQLGRCAAALAATGSVSTAARLLACSDAFRTEIGVGTAPDIAAENERTLAVIHAQLDDAAFAEAWEAGRALTVDAAVALAHGAIRQRGITHLDSRPPHLVRPAMANRSRPPHLT